MLDFKIFPKRQKTAKNYWKLLENDKNSAKCRKNVNIIAFKLIFINKSTEITNLEKHACQNPVVMATSSF